MERQSPSSSQSDCGAPAAGGAQNTGGGGGTPLPALLPTSLPPAAPAPSRPLIMPEPSLPHRPRIARPGEDSAPPRAAPPASPALSERAGEGGALPLPSLAGRPRCSSRPSARGDLKPPGGCGAARTRACVGHGRRGLARMRRRAGGRPRATWALRNGAPPPAPRRPRTRRVRASRHLVSGARP